MTHSSFPSLRKTLLAAGALTVLAAAPAAMAAPAVSMATPVSAQTQTDVILVADRDRHRSHRSHRSHRFDRGHRSHRSHRSTRGYKKHKSKYRSSGYRNSGYKYSHKKHYKKHYKPYKPYYKHHKPNYKKHSNYYKPYKSRVGISFVFGNSGYSPYRWAPSNYGFYQSGYGSYDNYRSSTTCRRVNVEAWHHGHRELISVKQCSNPWDGTYVIQGSERVINCAY